MTQATVIGVEQLAKEGQNDPRYSHSEGRRRRLLCCPGRFVNGGVFLFVALIIYQVWKSCLVVPIPEGDQLYFYPIYLSVANLQGLENPLLSPLEVGEKPDRPGAGRLVWHGWLQPSLQGQLARLFGADIRGALLADTVVIGVALLFFSIASQRLGSWIPHYAALPIVFTSFVASEGRPELLAGALLLIWVVAHELRTTIHYRIVASSAALAALAITQPTVAILASSAYLIVILCQNGPLGFIAWLSANVLAAVFGLIVTEVFYPYGVLEWLEGMLQMARFGAQRNDTGGVIEYFLLNIFRPLHGLILLSCAEVGVRYLGKVGPKVLVLTAAGILVMLSWYFAFRAAAANYNIMCFVPVALLFIGRSARNATLLSRATLTVVACASLGPMCLTVYSAFWGKSRSQFANYIDDVALNKGRRTIQVDLPLLVSAVPFARWPEYSYFREIHECQEQSIVIIKQVNSASFSPPLVSGCKLIRNDFASRPLSVSPWVRLPVPKAYNSATYMSATTLEGSPQP
jgi:hypothetical protein